MIVSVAPAVGEEAREPAVVSRILLRAERFFGAASKDSAFLVLADGTLHAFSVRGAKLWERDAPWYKPTRELGGVPNFNRTSPVSLDNGVAVLSCRDWGLVLEIFDLQGRQTASVQPVSHNMNIQEGHLALGRAGDSLAFGYRLSRERKRRNPDKGLLIFDAELKQRFKHDAWGDRMCCMPDGSVYAPTVRWGKDLKWCRFTGDGRKHPLPETVSRRTTVLQPGHDSTVVLWGRREDSAGRRPDGALDSIGLRRIWRPSQPEARIIHEFWASWLGHVFASGRGRYVLGTGPNRRRQVVCVDTHGKILWQHKLTRSISFLSALPVCDKAGNLYLLDTRRGKKPGLHEIFLKCLSPSGQKTWQLPVDDTGGPPSFHSALAASESHLLLVRRDRRNSVELIFVALPQTDTNGPNKAIDSDKE